MYIRRDSAGTLLGGLTAPRRVGTPPGRLGGSSVFCDNDAGERSRIIAEPPHDAGAVYRFMRTGVSPFQIR
jgi:hypothetical protein